MSEQAQVLFEKNFFLNISEEIKELKVEEDFRLKRDKCPHFVS